MGRAKGISESVSVAYLITELSAGGAQSALLRLLKALDRQRFSPSVACFYNGDGMVGEAIRALEIPVFDAQVRSKINAAATLRLFRSIRDRRPTILHTSLFHANVPGRLLGRAARVPYIVSSERTMGQESRTRCLLNRATAWAADRITCVSKSVAQFAELSIGLPSDKLVVIPNGVDVADFGALPSQQMARSYAGLPLDATIVGAIGRPRPVKGYHILLDAFARLAPSWPAAHLVFVGDGPDRPMLVAMASEQGLQSRVTFLEDSSSVPHLLPALNLLVIPSLFEGMPNVALEAMASGLPVVATDVGGTPEVVLNGVTGLLVPRNDSHQLGQAIEALMRDPVLARRLGIAGRQRVAEHFDIASTVRMTEALYDDLLAARQSE